MNEASKSFTHVAVIFYKRKDVLLCIYIFWNMIFQLEYNRCGRYFNSLEYIFFQGAYAVFFVFWKRKNKLCEDVNKIDKELSTRNKYFNCEK